MNPDYLGNPTSTKSDKTLRGIDDFVAGFLGYETKASNVMGAADADPESALANIYAGFSWMFLEAAGAKDKAAIYLQRAEGNAADANLREKMLLVQLRLWIADDIPAVQAVGESIVEAFPRDLASVKLHQYFSFNRGDAPAMLRIAEKALPENPNDPHLLGMLAFGYEQMHRLDDAERAARRALDLKQKEPWAQHALAHVMISTGRVREGERFLGEASAGWADLNSFMYTHNWWHRALFSISLGDDAAVFAAYDRHVWGREKAYSQDQVGAVSLLARMEIAGMDVGDRWADVADYLRPRANDTLQPFLTIQYLYGLARAGWGEADLLLRAVEDAARDMKRFDHKVWVEVALPACRGVLAHARGRHEEAVRWLAPVAPRITEIGGSHAQRDLFGQILLDAHLKAGHWAIARNMLEMRRIWDPDGVPLNRMLGEVDAQMKAAE
jgi:tetratricopeptide (TPR) repeat protein